MWKNIFSVIGIIVAIFVGAIVLGIGNIVGKSVGNAVSASSKPSQQQTEEQVIEGLNKAAEQSNRQGPRMVDKETRLDSTLVGPGTRVTYYYSLVNYSSSDITKSWLESNLMPIVKSAVCSNKDMEQLLQLGVTYFYAYRGSNGVEIARFKFDQHDCNLPSAP